MLFMEYLASVVFERTSAGAVAIKATGDAVPRQLRTLLLAIDGRSPVSRYVPFLTALAPLSEKFAQLELMGFACRKSDAGALPTQTQTLANASVSATLSERDLLDLALALHSSEPAPRATDNAPRALLDPFESQLRVLAWESTSLGGRELPTNIATASPTVAAQIAPSTSANKPQLRDLLNEMQGFLSQTAGMEGLPVAVMLEQITSLTQLRSELSAYSDLVTSYGGEVAEHLRKLRDLLERAEQ